MSKKKSGLKDFEDLAVVRSTIAITNAGDGLSEAMKVEPQEFRQGDKLFVVIECEVAKVTFVPIDKNEPKGLQSRVHTLRAGVATIVDGKLVHDLVREQEEKNLRAREEEAGVARLPLEPLDPIGERVRIWLTSLGKSDLVELCAKHGVDHPAKATAIQLIDLLAANADKIKEEIGEPTNEG